MSASTRTTSASPPTSSIESDGEAFATALGRLATCFFGTVRFGAGFTLFFFTARDVVFVVRTRVRTAGGGATAGGGERRVGSTGAGAGGGWTDCALGGDGAGEGGGEGGWGWG